MRVTILKLLVNVGGFYLASFFFPRITYSAPSSLLWAGILLGAVNLLIRPVLIMLTLPINLFTFGLFTLVVNTLMVLLAGALTKGLHIPGFGHALAIAIFISLLNMLFFD